MRVKGFFWGFFRRPAASHTDFACWRVGMVDGEDGVHLLGLLEECLHGRDCCPNAEVDEVCRAEEVCVSPEGCDFPAGDEEKLIEVWLQLAERVVVRIGVVVGDGDEI